MPSQVRILLPPFPVPFPTRFQSPARNQVGPSGHPPATAISSSRDNLFTPVFTPAGDGLWQSVAAASGTDIKTSQHTHSRRPRTRRSRHCALRTVGPTRARRGRSSMVELQPSKLVVWVRFPSPALVPASPGAPTWSPKPDRRVPQNHPGGSRLNPLL